MAGRGLHWLKSEMAKLESKPEVATAERAVSADGQAQHKVQQHDVAQHRRKAAITPT